MLKFFIQGGVLLLPILALSVVALALIIERIVYFYRIKEIHSDLGSFIVKHLKAGKRRKARMELEERNSPEAGVLLAGFKALSDGYSVESIGHFMETQALRSTNELEKNVDYLSSIANLSTLLGLLGTVTGMIVSFLNMKVSGISDPALLAGGISQALITTAAGLTVAIPCLLFFHLFRQRVNRTISKMEIAMTELLSFTSRGEIPTGI